MGKPGKTSEPGEMEHHWRNVISDFPEQTIGLPEGKMFVGRWDHDILCCYIMG